MMTGSIIAAGICTSQPSPPSHRSFEVTEVFPIENVLQAQTKQALKGEKEQNVLLLRQVRYGISL